MRGAFGIALAAGLGSDHPALPQAPSSWPRWQVQLSHDTRPDITLEVPLLVGGSVQIEAEARRAWLHRTPLPSAAAMMHPWLSTIASIASHIKGQLNFHGGGVVVAGRVWVVLGVKEAGKSTALAHLHERGHIVTADDLVVVEGTTCLSGPGCIDLREPSARALSLGEREDLGSGRVRYRVWTGAPPAELPLGGFVLPTWGSAHAVDVVPAAEKLPILSSCRSAFFDTGRDPILISAAARPMLRWTRPRDLTQLDVAADLLTSTIEMRDRCAP